jgi:Virulence protein
MLHLAIFAPPREPVRGADVTPGPGGQFLVYQTQDGKLKIDVRFEGETVWLTQQQMAELFQTTKQNVSLHIQNVYEEKELARVATVKESLTVQQEGTRSVQRLRCLRIRFGLLPLGG